MRTARSVLFILPLFALGACATAGGGRSSAPTSREQQLDSSPSGTTAGAPAAPVYTDVRAATLADRKRRALQRGATVFDREALAGNDYLRAVDLLSRLPSSTVNGDNSSTTSVSLRNCSVHGDAVSVYIDGTRTTDAVGALNSYLASELEMVEVYQGAAQLPLEVSRGCSAVFLWTRRRMG